MIPFLLALAGSILAQQPGTSRTTLVTVADARNHPIVDLGPDDVVIREGPGDAVGPGGTPDPGSPGHPDARRAPDAASVREIISVHTADYPVIVLIDTGSAARDDFPLIRKAAARFIDRLGRRPIAIGTLANPPALVTDFEDGLERVLGRLDALTADAARESAPLQSIAMAARKLAASGALFSAIVVLSATGVDRPTGRGEELIGPIIDSGVIVQVIANGANRPPPGTPVGQESLDQRGNHLLRDVAQQTLGQFTSIYSAASYQAALDRLADRMSNELMIEYLVPAGSKATDVRVGVRIPGARVRGLGVRPR